MNAWPSFTVAILSHKRPRLLRRVLGAVAQLDYPEFEVVVVGDQSSIEDYCLDPGIARQIRYRQLTESNISKGRNIALTMAAGDIVAFTDDDAAPEPNWLRGLAEAFRRPQVAAASGRVLAADGITLEWKGCLFNPAGREMPVDVPKTGLLIADPYSQNTDNAYLGLIGVNSAFRRTAALQSGGFDEAYHYFLEETDLALRLARSGWSAALTPDAVVHHLREENVTRTNTRVPRDLFQVAASKAHFCRRHLPAEQVAAELERYRTARLRELDPYLRLGVLRRDGMRKLERQLDRGLAEGGGREAVLPLTPGLAPPNLYRFQNPGPSPALRIAVVSGWGAAQIARTRRLARTLAHAGHNVSCFSYISGFQPARVAFVEGMWLHRGGTWRRNQRDRGGQMVLSRCDRATAEIGRVARDRIFDVVIRPRRPGNVDDDFAVRMPQLSHLGEMVAVAPDVDRKLSTGTLQALSTALQHGKGKNGSEPDPASATDARDPRQAVSGEPSIGYS